MNQLEWMQRQIEKLTTQVNALSTLDKPNRLNAWQPIFQAASYVSASSILFTGADLTTYMTGYVKCRWYQSGWKYGYIASSSLGSGNTTATLVTNTSYTVSNAAITDFSISYGSPPDFTPYLTWAAVPTGVTIGNGITQARFSITEKKLFFDFVFTLGSSSSVSGEFSFNLPLTVRTNPVSTVTGDLRDTGTANHATIAILSTTRCYIYRIVVSGVAVTGGLLDSTTPFTWATNDQIGATGWCMLP